MFAVDCHAHIYNKRIAARAVESVGEFYDIDMNCSGISEELINITKTSPVKHFVVNAVALNPKPVQKLNDFIALECRQHPEFTGLGTLHPDMEHMDSEIDRILSLGLHGVKLHPDTQGFQADSDKAFRIYEKIEGKLPLLIHCGDYRYDNSHPKRIANIIDNFPHLTIVAAHFGGWSIFDEAVPYLLNRNCYLDISSSMPFIEHAKVYEYIKLYSADRLLFGSDFPMWNPVDEYNSFMEFPLSKDEQEKILFKNALKVFNINLD